LAALAVEPAFAAVNVPADLGELAAAEAVCGKVATATGRLADAFGVFGASTCRLHPELSTAIAVNK
jgi:hypothetical protein